MRWRRAGCWLVTALSIAAIIALPGRAHAQPPHTHTCTAHR